MKNMKINNNKLKLGMRKIRGKYSFIIRFLEQVIHLLSLQKVIMGKKGKKYKVKNKNSKFSIKMFMIKWSNNNHSKFSI